MSSDEEETIQNMRDMSLDEIAKLDPFRLGGT